MDENSLPDEPNPSGNEIKGDKVEGNKIEVGSISGVSGGNVNVAGGNIVQRFTNVFTGIGERVFERFRKQQLIGFALLAVIILASALALYLGLKPRRPHSMPGGFGIVVAGFTKVGADGDKQLGVGIAKEMQSILEANLEEIQVGDLSLKYPITIWGPDQVGSIQGKTSEERALKAEALSREIGAEIVVYGAVDTSSPLWEIAPEFYVSTDSFYDAQEITGQSQFGRAIELSGQVDLAGLDMITPMYIRSQALSRLTIGLAYYAARQYPQALQVFQATEAISGWGDDQGKEVLYLLMGNTVAKEYHAPLQQNSDAIPDVEKLDQAEAYYQRAKEINPEYSRAYVGLGSMAFYRALLPFQQSKQYQDTDTQWLEESIQLNQQALQAAVQPPLAEIQSKVHLNLGSCYLMQVLAGVTEWFDPAKAEFQAVITEYDNRQDESAQRRIKELASEAHARLALIYSLSSRPDEALKQYQQALDLSDIGSRREQYQKRIDELTANLGGGTP